MYSAYSCKPYFQLLLAILCDVQNKPIVNIGDSEAVTLSTTAAFDEDLVFEVPRHNNAEICSSSGTKSLSKTLPTAEL